MYTIEGFYTTGDSFNTYDTSSVLDGVWILEVAKENLRRIKEHTNLRRARDNYISIATDWKTHVDSKKNELWFIEGTSYGMGKWEMNIKLLENDGSNKEYHLPWCGYFDHLTSAKVVGIQPNVSDLEFYV
ncbi:MAG: hypothetical protein WC358_09635 [Ignavibacteria bacterium]|jgi:hypothetical protein